MSSILVPPFDDGVPLKGVGTEHIRDKSIVSNHLANGLILPAHLNPSSFGAVGNITVIDPDDPAAAGATGLVADAGHQHAWTTSTASGLTKTATSAEGSGSGGARPDHTHATDVLPWGIMSPRFSATADSSAYSAGNTTDFVIADMVVDVLRAYIVHLHSHISISAATTWSVNFHVDATATLEMYHQQTVSGAGGQHISASALWLPTSGTKDLDIRVATGSGTITFNATSATPRQFWVEDIGLR